MVIIKMGIRGMETYIENYTNACIKVNVLELIERYKKDYHQNPTIVIDGLSVLKYLYSFKKLSWIYGGQMKEYKEVLIHFIHTFHAAGARLVFYFDGQLDKKKLETWIQRRKECLQKINIFLDNLPYWSSGENKDYNNQQFLFLLPNNLRYVTIYVALEYGCQVYTSSRECDLEIAEFAFRNQAMAILGQDSDFIIFDAAKYYLSMKHFDMKDMTTCIYDRIKLASHLGITGQHLPLLATLLGNDVIPSEQLQDFHKYLRNQERYGGYSQNFNYRSSVISATARFVCKYPAKFKLSRLELEELAFRVFLDATKASLIEQSLLSYDVEGESNKDGYKGSPNKHWDDILKKAYEMHKESKMINMIYSILSDNQYISAECFEDYRKTDLPAAQIVLATLRQKLYGVLLHEKPGSEPKCVQELIVCSPNSFYEPVPVGVIAPSVGHPGLLALWEEKAVEGSWELLADIYDVGIEKMRSLPAHLIVPAISFKYLKKYIALRMWEWNAIISSAVLVFYYNANTLSKTSDSHPDETRPYRIYTIISRAYSSAFIISRCIGNPIPIDMALPINYQDGKLYHFKYQQSKSGCGVAELCDHNESAIFEFNQIQRFMDNE